MANYRVFVTGLPNSTRLQFMQSASYFPPISIEKKNIKKGNIIPMIYGRSSIGEHMVYMYSPAEYTDPKSIQEIWQSLVEEMNGSILFVSGIDQDFFGEAKQLLNILTLQPSMPYIVVATDINKKNSISLNKIQTILNIDEANMMTCTSTEPSSVRQVLEQTLNWM